MDLFPRLIGFIGRMLLVGVLPFLIVLAAVALTVPASVTTGVIAFLLAFDIDWSFAHSIGERRLLHFLT